ncbi:MAG: hypothetical protein LBJ35_07630 [Spirochaetaceae bacterium]|jgi:hypothetical protein|nr:hypothetical protein [Spirochaetaceae bacterium]
MKKMFLTSGRAAVLGILIFLAASCDDVFDEIVLPPIPMDGMVVTYMGDPTDDHNTYHRWKKDYNNKKCPRRAPDIFEQDRTRRAAEDRKFSPCEVCKPDRESIIYEKTWYF